MINFMRKYSQNISIIQFSSDDKYFKNSTHVEVCSQSFTFLRIKNVSNS